MFFKNATLLRLTQTPDVGGLADTLAARAFRPCGSLETQTSGWVPPVGDEATDLVHTVNGRTILCLQTEEKIIPGPAVRKEVADRVAKIESEQGRIVRRKEKMAIKEEVLHDMLTRAFTRLRKTYGYIDTGTGMLVVNSASKKDVGLFTTVLRVTIGTLPAHPLRVTAPVAERMTAWLHSKELPPGFTLDSMCELRSDGGKVSFRGQDLYAEEVDANLQAGKRVKQLGLGWNGRMTFVLNDALVLKRIQFEDIVREQAADAEDAAALFDAEFTLMTGEFAAILPALIQAFDGEGEQPPYTAN